MRTNIGLLQKRLLATMSGRSRSGGLLGIEIGHKIVPRLIVHVELDPSQRATKSRCRRLGWRLRLECSVVDDSWTGCAPLSFDPLELDVGVQLTLLVMVGDGRKTAPV